MEEREKAIWREKREKIKIKNKECGIWMFNILIRFGRRNKK
jgi:hypothetical protein